MYLEWNSWYFVAFGTNFLVLCYSWFTIGLQLVCCWFVVGLLLVEGVWGNQAETNQKPTGAASPRVVPTLVLLQCVTFIKANCEPTANQLPIQQQCCWFGGADDWPVGLQLVCGWFVIGLLLASWFTVGLQLVCSWFAVG